MLFQHTQDIRDHFDVTKYWATSAGFGLGIPFVTFLIALFWWIRCQPLWGINDERASDITLHCSRIDWIWLT